MSSPYHFPIREIRKYREINDIQITVLEKELTFEIQIRRLEKEKLQNKFFLR
jgi:hypothetical protein